MNSFLWSVYPYLCIGIFFVVPIIRMAYKPFSWSTRASGLFSRTSLGLGSRFFHWGLLLVVVGHLLGLYGGLVGSETAITVFYWIGLAGGCSVLFGSILLLYRRLRTPEVRAMSQSDDYVVHLFIIAIVSLALWQVLVDQIFGVAYPVSSWVASTWTGSPQPELMGSVTTISKLHILLALTFIAYFPFTKLVHVWSFPVNFIVRPRQSMRTVKYRFQRKWELSMRSDKSWMLLGMGIVVAAFASGAALLGSATSANAEGSSSVAGDGRLGGAALYVSQCARCHGTRGEGNGPGAASPTFAARPRDLTKGEYRFVSTRNSVASDADLRRVIRRGLPSAGMPAFDQLSDAQVDTLVDVLNRMWKGRRAPGPAIVIPPRPPRTAAQAEKGRELYQSICGPCHGQSGTGDGPVGKALATRPRNLNGPFKAGNAAEDIYMRIAAGTPPLMPAYGTLPPEDIWAIVTHVEAEFIGR